MNLREFVLKIPKDKSVDIRPHVAQQVRDFIDQNGADVRSTHLSPAAYVIDKVCNSTGFVDRRTNRSEKGKKLSNSEKNSDYYTNVINAWAASDQSKRGKPDLARVVFYWFFRYVADPAYFIDIARSTWKSDSELFKRFCYAKEGGTPHDGFEAIMARFRSDEALNYITRFSSEQQRLSATYPHFAELGSSYQAKREEFTLAKGLLLSKGLKSIALTAAVYGAGGYGKSCLAQEICHDEDIRKKFTGGIYWLQFGLADSRDDSSGDVRLPAAIDRMLTGQYPKAERPSLAWDNRDSDILTLLEVLPKEPLLLVADDLWTPPQWSWLTKVPKNVSVLGSGPIDWLRAM